MYVVRCAVTGPFVVVEPPNPRVEACRVTKKDPVLRFMRGHTDLKVVALILELEDLVYTRTDLPFDHRVNVCKTN